MSRIFSFLAILLFAACSLSSASSSANPLVLSESYIQRLNQKGLPWKAEKNKRFEGMTKEEAKRLLGTKKDFLPSETVKVARRKEEGKREKRDFPIQFDSRTQWPGCVHHVLDQGQCGSCWAFGATETLSDRFCIESNGKINVVLSPESLVSCDWEGNFGCSGGIPQLAWEYMEWAGILSLDCFPYTAGNGTVPDCPSSCVNGSQPFKKYYAAEFSQSTFLTAWEIQNAIFSDGPVEGTMSVYDDFFAYSSGVYVASDDAVYEGGHAIKIVGWGHDATSNLDYWIVQNSWGTDWGMNGYFWIQRGVDMCGIDRDASASKAALNSN